MFIQFRDQWYKSLRLTWYHLQQSIAAHAITHCSGCDFQNAFFYIIVFLIGNFRSGPDSAFTWILHDLTHDKTAWLQLMAWCHQWQQAITLDITWANVDPNLCRYMALLVGWVNLSHFKDAYTQSVNTLRPRQNGRHIQGDMFTGIFLNEIYQFQLRFHWCFFLRVQLTISSTGSVNGLSPTSNKQSSERQTISWA